jgi:hypothetical protein
MNFTEAEMAKLVEMGYVLVAPDLAEKEAFREYDNPSYRLERMPDCYRLATTTYDDDDRVFEDTYQRFYTFAEFVEYFS